MIRIFCYSFVVMLLSTAPAAAGPDAACGGPVEPQSVGERLATADIVPNLMSRPGSLRSESAELLKKAHEESMKAEAPPARCAEGCVLGEAPIVVLTSVPHKLREDHPNRELCTAKQQETRAAPVTAPSRRFESLDDLSGWIQDFTQGKGADGKRLYRRCDGGCSPHYTFLINPEETGVSAEAIAFCGPPRDRKDNNYLVSARYEWRCRKPTETGPSEH